MYYYIVLNRSLHTVATVRAGGRSRVLAMSLAIRANSFVATSIPESHVYLNSCVQLYTPRMYINIQYVIYKWPRGRIIILMIG